MLKGILLFIAGIFVGAVLGIMCIALVTAGRNK